MPVSRVFGDLIGGLVLDWPTHFLLLGLLESLYGFT